MVKIQSISYIIWFKVNYNNQQHYNMFMGTWRKANNSRRIYEHHLDLIYMAFKFEHQTQVQSEPKCDGFRTPTSST